MAKFQKGQSGNPAGRPPGPNKLTKELKDMILSALQGAGGEAYLQQQATENPTAFLTLVGKVLPLQVSGPGGEPLPAGGVHFIIAQQPGAENRT